MGEKSKGGLAEACARLEEGIEANKAAMGALVIRFQAEFGPKRGYDGYMLQLRKCGKRGCTACPHGIVWNFYSWKGKKIRYHGRTDQLSQTFWHTRSGETKDAFRSYVAEVKELNAERATLMTATRKIKMILYHCGLLSSE